jgi:hypothetical protein
MSEVSTYLESAGIHDPLKKVRRQISKPIESTLNGLT